MTLSLSYITFVVESPPYLIATAALFMAYGAWFILTKPSRVPVNEEVD